MTRMFGFCAAGDTEPLKSCKSGWRYVKQICVWKDPNGSNMDARLGSKTESDFLFGDNYSGLGDK